MSQKMMVKHDNVWKYVTHVYNNTKNLSYSGDPYLMYDVDSGAIEDVSDNNHTPSTMTGSIVNGTADRGGKVMRFDPGEGIETPCVINLATTSITLAAWFWFDSIATSGASIFMVLKPTAMAIKLYNGNIHINYTDSGGTFQEKDFGPAKNFFNVKEWVHISIQWTYDNKKLHLLINGIWRSYLQCTGTPQISTHFRTPNSDGNPTLIWVDDPRIYLYTFYGANVGETRTPQISIIMNGIGVWEEADRVYIKNSNVWKNTYIQPYNGGAYANWLFRSHDGNGVTNYNHHYDEAPAANASGLTYICSAGSCTLGESSVGYNLLSGSGAKWEMNTGTDTRYNMDLNVTSATISFWTARSGNAGSSFARACHFANESMVTQFYNNQMRFYMFSTSNWYDPIYSTAWTAGEWKFIIATWNHVSRQYKLYTIANVDPATAPITLEGTKTFSGTPKSTNMFNISSNSAESNTGGGFARVRIHKRAILSPYEMRNLAWEMSF